MRPYSLGMGSIGLPGDMSSPSRFVKAAFTKMNSANGNGETESISQFFHILDSVVQQRGVTKTPANRYEYTLYSSCCNTDKGIYYYTTYNNRSICGINMHKTDLDGSSLIRYPLITQQEVFMQN